MTEVLEEALVRGRAAPWGRRARLAWLGVERRELQGRPQRQEAEGPRGPRVAGEGGWAEASVVRAV